MKTLIKQWLLPPALFNTLQYSKALIKNYKDNFQIDKKSNDRFKNRHSKERCFVVGTGPSIKAQELTLLKDEFVIGVSGLFQHRDIESIAPNYYVLPPVFRGHGNYYDEDNFISWMKDMDTVLKNDTIMFLDIGDKKYIDKYQIFKDKQIIWINYMPWTQNTPIKQIDPLRMPSIFSVSEAAIQVALYLGFKELYLLGFDHSWQDDIWKHFDENYMKHFDEQKLTTCKEWVDSEHEMIRHAKIFNKYKKLNTLKENIYNANANPNSYVDTFPKVKFEDLFSK